MQRGRYRYQSNGHKGNRIQEDIRWRRYYCLSINYIAWGKRYLLRRDRRKWKQNRLDPTEEWFYDSFIDELDG